MQSLRQQQGERMDTIMLQAWHTVLKHLFSFCGLCSLTKSPIKVIEKVWIHSRNWGFSNVQVNAAISHFVDVTIKHVGEAVNSGSAYMWNPIFVAPSSGADQWLHLLLCGCPSWTDGSALPTCESNKVTPLKAQHRQGSKISNKGCSCSIRAHDTEHHRLFEDGFSETISFCCYTLRFWWDFHEKCVYSPTTIVCNKARWHAAPLTFASFINAESWFVVKSVLSVQCWWWLWQRGREGVTNCWCTQTDTSPQYTSFFLLIPGKSLESQRGHFGQQPIRSNLHSSVERTWGRRKAANNVTKQPVNKAF